jgi:hypothetical protein
MMPRYRFRLPDGQIFETERGAAWVAETYPEAEITHEVVPEGNGEASLVRYEAPIAAIEKTPIAAIEEAPAPRLRREPKNGAEPAPERAAEESNA